MKKRLAAVTFLYISFVILTLSYPVDAAEKIEVSDVRYWSYSEYTRVVISLEAKIYNDVVGNKESRKLDGLNLIIDHGMAWADFRSTTAWRHFETVNRVDEDGTNIPADYFDTSNIEDNDSFYQEFKLSAQTERFDWVAGVSYYSETAKQASDTHALTDSIDTLGRNLGIYERAGLITPDGTLYRFTSDVLAAYGITDPLGDPVTMLGLPWREVMYKDGDFNATALFGDVIWARQRPDEPHRRPALYTRRQEVQLAPRGARDPGARRHGRCPAGRRILAVEFPIPPEAYRLADFIFRTDTPNGGAEKVTLEDSWDDISPRFVLDYDVNADVMVFGSLAKGYKAIVAEVGVTVLRLPFSWKRQEAKKLCGA